jgi:hypothetical protein
MAIGEAALAWNYLQDEVYRAMALASQGVPLRRISELRYLPRTQPKE